MKVYPLWVLQATWTHKPSGTILHLRKTPAGLLLYYIFSAMLSFRKPLFDINCCHTAKACSSYSLSVSMIMNISSRKHAFNACLRVLLQDDIALIVKLELSLENCSIGLVANCHKEATCLDSSFLTSIDILDQDS